MNQNVLIVDDDSSLRTALRDALEKSGYTIFEAPDGLACITILEQQPIDVMLLDIQMPVLDGIGVLKALENNKEITQIPFTIVLTNNDDISTLADAFAHHVFKYLIKADTTIAQLVEITKEYFSTKK